MYYVPKALNKQKFDIDLKIARPASSLNFMDTAKTIDLIRLCIQVTNTVVSNHTHIKLIKKFKTKYMSTVNRKYTK